MVGRTRVIEAGGTRRTVNVYTLGLTFLRYTASGAALPDAPGINWSETGTVGPSSRPGVFRQVAPTSTRALEAPPAQSRRSRPVGPRSGARTMTVSLRR